MNGNGSWDFLDAITIVSFMVGMANYEENVNQSQMNDAITGAVRDVHEHLRLQDQKLDEILSYLKGETQNGNGYPQKRL